MSAPRLIGLTGPARSGKDTTAEILVREAGFVRIAFADPLRDFVRRLLGYTPEDLETRKEDPTEFGPSPREMMQTLGTEWGRETISPELWLRVARREIEANLAAGRSVVLSDVRFPNEADLVQELGGELWRILRRTGDRIRVRDHKSEGGVSIMLCDVVLANNGTIEDLTRAVRGHIGSPGLEGAIASA